MVAYDRNPHKFVVGQTYNYADSETGETYLVEYKEERGGIHYYTSIGALFHGHDFMLAKADIKNISII